MAKRIKAWHFLPDDGRLRYGDRRIVEPGSIVTVEGPPRLCEWGMHASRSIMDALTYSRGSLLCRVWIGGEIVEGDDKIAGTSREVEWMLDARELLFEFACLCAEKACKESRVAQPRDARADSERRLPRLRGRDELLDAASRAQVDAAPEGCD